MEPAPSLAFPVSTRLTHDRCQHQRLREATPKSMPWHHLGSARMACHSRLAPAAGQQEFQSEKDLQGRARAGRRRGRVPGCQLGVRLRINSPVATMPMAATAIIHGAGTGAIGASSPPRDHLRSTRPPPSSNWSASRASATEPAWRRGSLLVWAKPAAGQASASRNATPARRATVAARCVDVAKGTSGGRRAQRLCASSPR